MSQSAKSPLDNFDRLFENINDIVGDAKLKGEIKQSIGTLPEIFEEVRVTVGDTRQTINSFQSVTGKANKNLDNLESFTGSLKENGPEILLQVRESLNNVDGLGYPNPGIYRFVEQTAKLRGHDRKTIERY